MKYKKLFISLFVLACLVLVTLVALRAQSINPAGIHTAATPTTDLLPTSDYLTYTDQKLNIQLRYPRWFAYDDSLAGVIYFYPTHQIVPTNYPSKHGIQLEILKRTGTPAAASQSELPDETFEPVTINGITGLRRTSHNMVDYYMSVPNNPGLTLRFLYEDESGAGLSHLELSNDQLAAITIINSYTALLMR